MIPNELNSSYQHSVAPVVSICSQVPLHPTSDSSVDPERTQQQLPVFSCTSYIYLLPVASNQNAQYKQLFCYTLPCYKKFSPKHLYLWSAHKEKWCWMGQKFASRRNKKKGTQRCIQWRNCKKQSWHLWIALWQHLHFQQW